MKVYVVMSNDYPDAVFKKEEDAKNYCKLKKIEKREGSRTTIYWRTYEFELR